jgi:hypothetical protein
MADGKLNRAPGLDSSEVKLMSSQFKKRDSERKGDKKQENLRKKLIEDNIDDLRDISGEEK